MPVVTRAQTRHRNYVGMDTRGGDNLCRLKHRAECRRNTTQRWNNSVRTYGTQSGKIYETLKHTRGEIELCQERGIHICSATGIGRPGQQQQQQKRYGSELPGSSVTHRLYWSCEVNWSCTNLLRHPQHWELRNQPMIPYRDLPRWVFTTVLFTKIDTPVFLPPFCSDNKNQIRTCSVDWSLEYN